MRIPLTGDYKEYEMYKELLEMINEYKRINKRNEIFNKLKELKPIYLKEGIEIIGLLGGYERDETTIWIAYQMNDDFNKKYDNGFKKIIRLQEIKEELKSIFKNGIEFMPMQNLKDKDDLILI